MSLASAKSMLLVDHNADDALITAGSGGDSRSAGAGESQHGDWQTLRLALDGWPADEVIRLWRPPVRV